METCIFCKIVSGGIPSRKVYEDDNVLAFYDINPKAPVHIIVVPKIHVENILEAVGEDKIFDNMMSAVKEIAETLGFAENGFRLVVNTGRDGGQSVGHLHFHILAGVAFGESFG